VVHLAKSRENNHEKKVYFLFLEKKVYLKNGKKREKVTKNEAA